MNLVVTGSADFVPVDEYVVAALDGGVESAGGSEEADAGAAGEVGATEVVAGFDPVGVGVAGIEVVVVVVELGVLGEGAYVAGNGAVEATMDLVVVAAVDAIPVELDGTATVGLGCEVAGGGGDGDA